MENIPLDSKKKFHVFLNFRGEDVRKNLVEHLYESLSNAGLRVFLDSEELGKGKIIESALRIAIERSDILIPIFSKGYANSTWCLREAAWMCSSNALIIPLFYDVQPCDVKYPVKKGSPYAKAFEEHYSHLDRHDINTIEQWKKALHQISCRSGWSMEAESGYQGRLVKTIVRDVINKLRSVPFVVAEHPVGLERDKKKLIQKLNLSLIDNVVRLGICGIGGIGKTTMAKAVYNEIHREFDASCFVFNVGATAENITGLMELQRRILNDLVDYHGEVPSVDHGKSLMKDRLRGVLALVILDDLNHKSQLNALGGDWFAPGSRVIITSRDQHILNLGNVVSIHQMNGLAQDEAIQLFSWHAFSRVSPDTPYEELSPRIAKACCGHPLSLEVIGSHLYDKKAAEDIDCWEEALHNIATSGDIFRVLRISFDELCAVEREIFLDIACYFIGEKKRDSIIFWEALYQKKAQTAVKNLAQRMLIKISGPHHLLGMHDLLRDMGRGILEQTGNNSRLWLPRDAQTVFSRDRRHPMSNTMLAYIGEKRREPVSLPSMPHLRYLFLQNTKVVGNMGKLAPNLIWIRIRNCEFVIDMTRMEELCRWLTLKNKLHFIGSWSQLRILTLEECACLTALPNTMGNLSQLKQLNVHQCTGLDNLPETIGNLMQLEVLDLSRCTGLGSLPNTMGNLAQLEKLDLRGCAGLGSLPDTMGNLVQLKRLYLRRCTGIRRLPEMVGKLAQLHKLDLHGCTRLDSLPDTVGNLVQLQWLDLRWCRCLESLPSTMENLSQLFGLDLRGCTGLGSLPSTIGNLEKLWELDLRGCTGLRILPDTVGNLVQLQRLYLRGCTGLGILPETLGNLVQIQQLDLRGCTSLECLPDMVGSLVQIQELVLSRCVGLRSLPEKVGKLVQLKELYLHGCTSLASLPKKLGNLSQLQLLDLTGCTCLGSLPDTIGSLSQLQLLELSGCTYLESIPNTIGNLTQLERLNLSGCERLGSLPYKVGSLIQLEQVDLSSCAGLQSLPDTIGNLVQLKKLDLSRCRHLGSLPNTVGNLVQLRQLDLSDCAHLRSLPHTVGNLGQLRQLDLSGCARLGSLPHTVGNLGQLRQLHLSGCARLGSLPNTMGNLALLKWLNLTGCAHLGSLPNTIGNLAKLLKLDLHGCVRLGSLPHTVGTLTQLKRLYLTRSESTEGPPNIDTIGTSAKLQQFDLIELAKLRIFLSPSTDMEGTLAQLKWLDLHKCGSLPRLPDIAGNLAQLQWLGLSGCPSLENIPNMIDNL